MKTQIILILTLFSFNCCAQKKIKEADKLVKDGDKLYSERNYKGAIICFSQALIEFPSEKELYKKRANSFYNLSKFDSTIIDCNKVITLSAFCDSLCVLAKVLKANSFERMNILDSARTLYFEILKEQPKDFNTLISLGTFYGDQNKYDSCTFYLNKAHDVNKNSIAPIVDLIFYSNESGYYREALKYAQSYSFLFQDSVWKAVNLNNMGYSKLMLGESDEGLLLINQSLILYPKNSFAYKNRALYYISKNDIKSACENLNTAKELGGIYITKTLIEKYCK